MKDLVDAVGLKHPLRLRGFYETISFHLVAAGKNEIQTATEVLEAAKKYLLFALEFETEKIWNLPGNNILETVELVVVAEIMVISPQKKVAAAENVKNGVEMLVTVTERGRI